MMRLPQGHIPARERARNGAFRDTKGRLRYKNLRSDEWKQVCNDIIEEYEKGLYPKPKVKVGEIVRIKADSYRVKKVVFLKDPPIYGKNQRRRYPGYYYKLFELPEWIPETMLRLRGAKDHFVAENFYYLVNHNTKSFEGKPFSSLKMAIFLAGKKTKEKGIEIMKGDKVKKLLTKKNYSVIQEIKNKMEIQEKPEIPKDVSEKPKYEIKELVVYNGRKYYVTHIRWFKDRYLKRKDTHSTEGFEYKIYPAHATSPEVTIWLNERQVAPAKDPRYK
jgi:hypothetical protein